MAQPKTAYELLERVCGAIKNQPQRYWQEDWCSPASERKYHGDSVKHLCDTAFCRAGFVVAEFDGYKAKPKDWAERAEEILNIKNAKQDTQSDWADLTDSITMDTSGLPGTKEYAREGIAGIRAFMRDNKDFLKRTLLPAKKKR